MSHSLENKVEEIRRLAKSLVLLAENSTLAEYKIRLLQAAGRLIEEADSLGHASSELDAPLCTASPSH